MTILITRSNDEGIEESIIVKIKNIDRFIKKINRDEIFLEQTDKNYNTKSSLKRDISIIIHDTEDYEDISLTKEEIKIAVTQTFIDGDSYSDLRFWQIKKKNIMPLKF